MMLYPTASSDNFRFIFQGKIFSLDSARFLERMISVLTSVFSWLSLSADFYQTNIVSEFSFGQNSIIQLELSMVSIFVIPSELSVGPISNVLSDLTDMHVS